MLGSFDNFILRDVQAEQVVQRVEGLDEVQDTRVRVDVVRHFRHHPLRCADAKRDPQNDVRKIPWGRRREKKREEGRHTVIK